MPFHFVPLQMGKLEDGETGFTVIVPSGGGAPIVRVGGVSSAAEEPTVWGVDALTKLARVIANVSWLCACAQSVNW